MVWQKGAYSMLVMPDAIQTFTQELGTNKSDYTCTRLAFLPQSTYLTHSLIHTPFCDRPKFKEAADDNLNVTIKGI